MSNSNGSKLFYLVVGNNIKKYRAIRNFSLQDLAERVGLTKKTIQRYENGEIKIDMDRLDDISSALEVGIPQLIEGAESFLGLSLEELNTVNLPIVGRVSCGNGVVAYEEVEGYEPTPKTWIRGGEYFYVRATGDSMNNARIYDGDLLLIRKQDDVEDGEIAAVLINEIVYLKRVFKNDGMLVLQSENPNYAPIFKTDEDQDSIKVLGKLKKVVINL